MSDIAITQIEITYRKKQLQDTTKQLSSVDFCGWYLVTSKKSKRTHPPIPK